MVVGSLGSVLAREDILPEEDGWVREGFLVMKDWMWSTVCSYQRKHSGKRQNSKMISSSINKSPVS